MGNLLGAQGQVMEFFYHSLASILDNCTRWPYLEFGLDYIHVLIKSLYKIECSGHFHNYKSMGIFFHLSRVSNSKVKSDLTQNQTYPRLNGFPHCLQ